MTVTTDRELHEFVVHALTRRKLREFEVHAVVASAANLDEVAGEVGFALAYRLLGQLRPDGTCLDMRLARFEVSGHSLDYERSDGAEAEVTATMLVGFDDDYSANLFGARLRDLVALEPDGWWVERVMEVLAINE